MSRPGIEPGPPRWEASTLTKIYSNIVLIGTVIWKSTYISASDNLYYFSPFSEVYRLLVFFKGNKLGGGNLGGIFFCPSRIQKQQQKRDVEKISYPTFF
jgi:hypothetical protein